MTRDTRLVLVGGGHSHVEVLRRFSMDGAPCNVALIARDLLAPYSGMLPGFIAGHYDHAQAHIDVRNLARAAGARVCHAEVTGIDFAAAQVRCVGRPDVPFDVLSLNVGSRPAQADVPGAAEYSWPAKPVDRFIARWEALLEDLSQRPRAHRIVVVGGGAGGVELSLAMHYRLTTMSPELAPMLNLAIITLDRQILPTHAAGVRRRMRRALTRRGIAIHTGERAVDVSRDGVRCESGTRVPFDTLVWTTHAAPWPWIRESGLATDDRGFLLVDESLRSVSHPNVFAAGDTASLQHAPRPKSGVFAVREGPHLAENLSRTIRGEPLVGYAPQKRHLALISTGDRKAVASWGPVCADGAWVWRWKDRIDRKWMAKYQGIMAPPPRTMGDGEAMQCAGCGAKLGHEVLRRALARLESVARPDVLIGLDAPDDAAVVELPPGMLAVHSVDIFPALVADPFVAGEIAAVHCLSDIYAMGASPHTALAIVTLPHGQPGMQEDTLTDLLAGALSVLMPEHTALVGGHTLEGDRLEFGLSVNGVIPRDRLLNSSAPLPGDRLILTKPLGIGAIFAADMRGQARPDWTAAAIEVMKQSNAAAARILFDHGATACTDVTGFGLAGHLLQLLRKFNVSAAIELDTIPVLSEAIRASRAGIRSTLYPANLASERDMESNDGVHARETYPLLFDPQTSGGLLAAVPSGRAGACAAELRGAGYDHAADIGFIEPASGRDRVLRLT